MSKVSVKQVLAWLNRVNIIPYGYCNCGCGRAAPVAKYSDVSKGWIHGEPKRFCNGHASRKKHNLIADPDTGCITWKACKQPNGYGRLGRDGINKQGMAHVVIYEKFVGSVPDSMELDHTCRNRACVNPNHLEPVTRIENVRRGSVPKLTPEQVMDIRMYSIAGISQAKIAMQYNVHPGTIQAIVERRTWKDVI